jgi:hypothetical protein
MVTVFHHNKIVSIVDINDAQVAVYNTHKQYGIPVDELETDSPKGPCWRQCWIKDNTETLTGPWTVKKSVLVHI